MSFTSSGRMRSKEPVASFSAISIGIHVNLLCSIASWTLFKALCALIPLTAPYYSGWFKECFFSYFGYALPRTSLRNALRSSSKSSMILNLFRKGRHRFCKIACTDFSYLG